MGRLPDLIETYIDAYNRKDVEGMLMCIADKMFFQNISGGEVTAEASDKQSFADMARFGASAFETRHQKVVNAITVAGTTLAEIDYSAVVATDLPNGWKAGQKLASQVHPRSALKAGKSSALSMKAKVRNGKRVNRWPSGWIPRT